MEVFSGTNNRGVINRTCDFASGSFFGHRFQTLPGVSIVYSANQYPIAELSTKLAESRSYRLYVVERREKGLPIPKMLAHVVPNKRADPCALKRLISELC